MTLLDTLRDRARPATSAPNANRPDGALPPVGWWTAPSAGALAAGDRVLEGAYERRGVVLAFPGQGSPQPGAGTHLHEADPAFAAALDEALAACADHGADLRAALERVDPHDLAARRSPALRAPQPPSIDDEDVRRFELRARGLRLRIDRADHDPGRQRHLDRARVADRLEDDRLL